MPVSNPIVIHLAFSVFDVAQSEQYMEQKFKMSDTYLLVMLN